MVQSQLWASEKPGGQDCLEELAEGGNFVCCPIIVVIFIGLGGTYKLGGDFKVVIWGPSHKELGAFFIGELTP